MYTKRRLGKELEMAIKQKYTVTQLSKWAEDLYVNHCRELQEDVERIVFTLSAMELGPEFEYTEQELRALAQLLLDDEADPLLKFSEWRLEPK